MQVIIDERADSAQREALTKILHGEETAGRRDALVGVSCNVGHHPSDTLQADRISKSISRPAQRASLLQVCWSRRAHR